MNDHHPFLDFLTWISAAVAVVSLAKAALLISCLAGLVSMALGLVRLHDRLKYGPRN